MVSSTEDQVPDFRHVIPNHTVALHPKSDEHPNHSFADNLIKTTKYSILTFLPKNLFEQFHRAANIYFVLIVILNWVPEISAFAREVAMLPVIFVLAVTAIKDAFEDYRRYCSDREINHLKATVYSRYFLCNM
jgi:phospholipid-translocating ATPase